MARRPKLALSEQTMASFKIGDKVSWNSEAGRARGTIIGVHTRDFDVNGYTHHATSETRRNMKSRVRKPIISPSTRVPR